MQDEYRNEPGSVIGSDFYGATELLGLSDDEIVKKVVANISRCDPRMQGAKVSNYILVMLCQNSLLSLDLASIHRLAVLFGQLLRKSSSKVNKKHMIIQMVLSLQATRSQGCISMCTCLHRRVLKLDRQYLCSLVCTTMWTWEARVGYNSSCKSSFQISRIDSLQ